MFNFEKIIYCKAKFERGSGIGTRLFPWARATYFSEVYGVKMLAPHWIQPRIGPILRGGIDLSAYHRQILLIGLFRRQKNEISGLKRLILETGSELLPEPSIAELLSNDYKLPKNGVINFSGDGGRFKYINGMSEYFKKKIIEITSKKWLEFVESNNRYVIGINVRMGNDFVTVNENLKIKNKEAIKTPVKWFVDSLTYIRKYAGKDLPAVVVTDGTEESISELLNMRNVNFLRPGCAISDLLVLSNCKILLRSGGSSFSAWAAYLGQMPTISPPGQGLDKFNLVNEYGKYIGDFDPDSPNELFLKDLAEIAKLN